MASRPTLTSVITPTNIITAHRICVRPVLALLFFIMPLIAQAIPANMGTFTLSTSTTSSNGSASGSYTTSAGATGTFTIVRKEMSGYQSNAIFTPGNNGIMIQNQSNTTSDRDKFSYTITITPTDKNSIHTIKIGQTSYNTRGNSEVARQSLSYTDFATNEQFTFPARATVLENPSVNYFFGAMGDYFMGQKLSGNSFSSNNSTVSPQLRVDDPNRNDLYYYSLTALNGNGNSSSFTPTLTNGNVTFAAGQKRGTLPAPATFENILKSTSTSPNNQTTYSALSTNTPISNGGSYVSYGIANSDSNYVMAVQNAKSVTLTYEGIMKGNSAIEADVVGETYNEWISFGVESKPIYVFSGSVFNDNGGITASPATRLDTSATFTGNRGYFNGVREDNESEITDPNLQVRLTDCNSGNDITGTTPQTLSSTGKYRFNVLPNTLTVGQNVCLVEVEPSSWDYNIDTTANKKQITITRGDYNYSNIDFGEVKAENAALVLKKYQYVQDCNDNLNYTSINQSTTNPSTGFSMNPARNVEPGKCIAYKIEAYNRGNTDLSEVQITDVLQKIPTQSKFHLPLPEGNPAQVFSNNNSVTLDANGKIVSNDRVVSNAFSLAKVSGSPTLATLYFNTKYDTTVSN